MKIVLKSKLKFSQPIDKLQKALLSPEMMCRVAWPMVKFVPENPPQFPEFWEQGKTYRLKMYAFYFIPLFWQELTISWENLENGSFIFKDIGPGFAVKLWDHSVVLTPIDSEKTNYDETLELTTNFLGPLLWIAMKILFLWREHRWKKLMRSI
jgi:hypothetical protein